MHKETEDYKLIVGDSMSSEKALKCYQVYNKLTEVIEYETTLLPKALNTIEGLQTDLDKIKEDMPTLN